MMTVWVDTDFGFDDLWALLLLASQKRQPAGISLVAGNTDLGQVCENAARAVHLFGLSSPLYRGADTPLSGQVIRATDILGATGMRAIGPGLPAVELPQQWPDAMTGLCRWLKEPGSEGKICIALGPLTNLASLAEMDPVAYGRLARIIWMGGSNGPGNHSPFAEFNAMADPVALARIASLPVPLQIVDLSLCRQVTISDTDITGIRKAGHGARADIFGNLLAGYLDIAHHRGRSSMAIYDPLAVLSYLRPALFGFAACTVSVATNQTDQFGKTDFSLASGGPHMLATSVRQAEARNFCLNEIARELAHG
jgi:purine nucleosidase